MVSVCALGSIGPGGIAMSAVMAAGCVFAWLPALDRSGGARWDGGAVAPNAPLPSSVGMRDGWEHVLLDRLPGAWARAVDWDRPARR